MLWAEMFLLLVLELKVLDLQQVQVDAQSVEKVLLILKTFVTNVGAQPVAYVYYCGCGKKTSFGGGGHSTVTKRCSSCGGSGKRTCSSCNGNYSWECTTCKGAGTTTVPTNCSHGFGPNTVHYYCSNHGNNVNQYH